MHTPPPASAQEIDMVSEMLTCLGLDPEIDLNTAVKTFKNQEPLQVFWRDHVRERHNIFQVGLH